MLRAMFNIVSIYSQPLYNNHTWSIQYYTWSSAQFHFPILLGNNRKSQNVQHFHIAMINNPGQIGQFHIVGMCVRVFQCVSVCFSGEQPI